MIDIQKMVSRDYLTEGGEGKRDRRVKLWLKYILLILACLTILAWE